MMVENAGHAKPRKKGSRRNEKKQEKKDALKARPKLKRPLELMRTVRVDGGDASIDGISDKEASGRCPPCLFHPLALNQPDKGVG